MGHVFKLAVRPDVAASISSNITFAACLNHRCIFGYQVKSLPFQHGKSVFFPDCCHRCLDARGTSESSPFVRTLPLRLAVTSLLRRVLIIGASQFKSLPFRHRKSVFIPGCCHRCLDARGTSASSPFAWAVRFEQPLFGHLIDVLSFSDFLQDQLDLLQSTSVPLRLTLKS